MTEYDFSPGAEERYQQKLRSIGRWARNTQKYPLVDPLTTGPSITGSMLAPEPEEREGRRPTRDRDERRYHDDRGHSRDGEDRGGRETSRHHSEERRDKSRHRDQSRYGSREPSRLREAREHSLSRAPPVPPLPNQIPPVPIHHFPRVEVPPTPTPYIPASKLSSPYNMQYASYSTRTLGTPNNYYGPTRYEIPQPPSMWCATTKAYQPVPIPHRTYQYDYLGRPATPAASPVSPPYQPGPTSFSPPKAQYSYSSPTGHQYASGSLPSRSRDPPVYPSPPKYEPPLKVIPVVPSVRVPLITHGQQPKRTLASRFAKLWGGGQKKEKRRDGYKRSRRNSF